MFSEVNLKNKKKRLLNFVGLSFFLKEDGEEETLSLCDVGVDLVFSPVFINFCEWEFRKVDEDKAFKETEDVLSSKLILEILSHSVFNPLWDFFRERYDTFCLSSGIEDFSLFDNVILELKLSLLEQFGFENIKSFIDEKLSSKGDNLVKAQITNVANGSFLEVVNDDLLRFPDNEEAKKRRLCGGSFFVSDMVWKVLLDNEFLVSVFYFLREKNKINESESNLLEYVVNYIVFLSQRVAINDFLDFFNLLRYHFKKGGNIEILVNLLKNDGEKKEKFITLLKKKELSELLKNEQKKKTLEDFFCQLFNYEYEILVSKEKIQTATKKTIDNETILNFFNKGVSPKVAAYLCLKDSSSIHFVSFSQDILWRKNNSSFLNFRNDEDFFNSKICELQKINVVLENISFLKERKAFLKEKIKFYEEKNVENDEMSQQAVSFLDACRFFKEEQQINNEELRKKVNSCVNFFSFCAQHMRLLFFLESELESDKKNNKGFILPEEIELEIKKLNCIKEGFRKSVLFGERQFDVAMLSKHDVKNKDLFKEEDDDVVFKKDYSRFFEEYSGFPYNDVDDINSKIETLEKKKKKQEKRLFEFKQKESIFLENLEQGENIISDFLKEEVWENGKILWERGVSFFKHFCHSFIVFLDCEFALIEKKKEYIVEDKETKILETVLRSLETSREAWLKKETEINNFLEKKETENKEGQDRDFFNNFFVFCKDLFFEEKENNCSVGKILKIVFERKKTLLLKNIDFYEKKQKMNSIFNKCWKWKINCLQSNFLHDEEKIFDSLKYYVKTNTLFFLDKARVDAGFVNNCFKKKRKNFFVFSPFFESQKFRFRNFQNLAYSFQEEKNVFDSSSGLVYIKFPLRSESLLASKPEDIITLCPVYRIPLNTVEAVDFFLVWNKELDIRKTMALTGETQTAIIEINNILITYFRPMAVYVLRPWIDERKKTVDNLFNELSEIKENEDNQCIDETNKEEQKNKKKRLCANWERKLEIWNDLNRFLFLESGNYFDLLTTKSLKERPVRVIYSPLSFWYENFNPVVLKCVQRLLATKKKDFFRIMRNLFSRGEREEVYLYFWLFNCLKTKGLAPCKLFIYDTPSAADSQNIFSKDSLDIFLDKLLKLSEARGELENSLENSEKLSSCQENSWLKEWTNINWIPLNKIEEENLLFDIFESIFVNYRPGVIWCWCLNNFFGFRLGFQQHFAETTNLDIFYDVLWLERNELSLIKVFEQVKSVLCPLIEEKIIKQEIAMNKKVKNFIVSTWTEPKSEWMLKNNKVAIARFLREEEEIFNELNSSSFSQAQKLFYYFISGFGDGFKNVFFCALKGNPEEYNVIFPQRHAVLHDPFLNNKENKKDEKQQRYGELLYYSVDVISDYDYQKPAIVIKKGEEENFCFFEGGDNKTVKKKIEEIINKDLEETTEDEEETKTGDKNNTDTTDDENRKTVVTSSPTPETVVTSSPTPETVVTSSPTLLSVSAPSDNKKKDGNLLFMVGAGGIGGGLFLLILFILFFVSRKKTIKTGKL